VIGVVVDSRLTIKLCQTTLRQFVGRLITSCDKFDPTHGVCIVDGCSSDNDPGIRLQSAELLQLGTHSYWFYNFSVTVTVTHSVSVRIENVDHVKRK